MEQLTVVKKNSKCYFCGISKNDYLRYGPMYRLGKIAAHYYCVLLSNRLIQNGKDDEGILGFLLSDIETELRRTSTVLCAYCKKGNATITCAASKCRRRFHLPCGLKNGTSHQFLCQFKSFCHVHRLVQNIPRKIFKEACRSQVICCICQEEVNVQAKSGDTLWAPCCLKTWYHRNCVQKLAYSAGYFCRCPACNDAKKFNEWMQQFGIFIPQQDASWELAPNAFEDLLFRYSNCDAEECKCPGGRQSNTENTLWEIILCDSCGSQGVHVACGNLRFLDPEWECGPCSRITKRVQSSATEVSDSCKPDVGSSKPEAGQKKRRRNSEDLENSVLDKRKRCRTSVEEEEIEIDVETVEEEVKHDETSASTCRYCGPEKSRDVGRAGHIQSEQTAAALRSDPQEVLKLLKPGPLSYKLSAIRKMLGDFTTPKRRPKHPEKSQSGKSSSSTTDVIQLSDSEDSDVEVVEEQKPEEGSGSILQCSLRKDGRTAVEEETKQPERQFSLGDFEVIAIVSVQPAEKAVVRGGPMDDALEKAPGLSRPNYFPGSLGTHRGQTPREDKELMKKAVDDDVIILTD